MPIFEVLRPSPHFKIAAVASHRQRVGDFIVSAEIHKNIAYKIGLLNLLTVIYS